MMDAFGLLLADNTITLIDLDNSTKALEIAHAPVDGQAGHIGPSDACFHALAFEQDAVFLTNDKKHFNKTVKSIGRVMLFSDWQAV